VERTIRIVRRGLRGDKLGGAGVSPALTGWKPIPPFKFKWNGSTSPGRLVRWLSPGNSGDTILISLGIPGTPY
jgi:hypothetical protein